MTPPSDRDALRDPSAPKLLEVKVGVEWGGGGPRERLLLRTLRLAPPDAEAEL